MEENRRNLKVEFLVVELKERVTFSSGREVLDGAIRREEWVIRGEEIGEKESKRSTGNGV